MEQTLKYRTSNTPNIECPNIELSEHHILAQNRTSNMSNITKKRTVREHQTVHSKTNTYTNTFLKYKCTYFVLDGSTLLDEMWRGEIFPFSCNLFISCSLISNDERISCKFLGLYSAARWQAVASKIHSSLWFTIPLPLINVFPRLFSLKGKLEVWFWILNLKKITQILPVYMPKYVLKVWSL